jgi:peptide/nickel transport system substrate-binding protein
MQHTTHSHSFFDTLTNLSPFERLFVGILLFFILISGTSLVYEANKRTFVEIPREGGTYTEGIVGTPRFINPLLAISHADKDLTSIVYAGLMTRDATGELTPELAESYSISEDGLVYTFTLREGLTFHDGTPLTAEDVVYTVSEAGNAAVRSPLFANWDGVQVEKGDDRTVIFTLPEPYMPFLENLTLNILPAHIWSGLTAEEFPFSQFNITPVGSGPYQVEVVARDKSGIPVKYTLTRFEDYALGSPYIRTIEFVLYNNDEEVLTAYKEGKINAINSVAPVRLEELLNSGTKVNTSVHRAPLLRVFGIFFNHNKQPVFLRDEVREALEIATPKKAIVGEILRGYGTLLDGPLPPYLTNTTALETSEDGGAPVSIEGDSKSEGTEKTPVNHIERAQHILEEEGWKKNEQGKYVLETEDETIPLIVSFTTVNTPELTQTAELIAKSWREVGAEVEVKVFEPTDLAQSVIRPRRFDTLLFGMVIGHELDLYAFWHSSQRNDPGLNIAQYADIEADSLLEKMRVEQDTNTRTTLYQNFAKLVREKNAAIFLYAPDFIYVVDDSIHNISIHPIAETSERFDTVHTWNIETDNVWAFLRKFFE